MTKIALGGYNWEWIEYKTETPYSAESIEKGICLAIERSRNLEVVRNIDLNEFVYRMFKKIEVLITDDVLLQFVQSKFKSTTITLDQLNLDLITQDYAYHIASQDLIEKSNIFEKFLKTL